MAQRLSWQVTVTTAGTAVQASATSTIGGTFLVKPDPNNTGSIYVGGDGEGDVSSTTGFELDPGEQAVIDLPTLSKLWVDSSVNGEKAHVLLMSAFDKSVY